MRASVFFGVPIGLGDAYQHGPLPLTKEFSVLVLSRQRDETIMIGDHIAVTVVDIRGDKVRLGIQAPGEIPVHRREVYEAIQREKRGTGDWVTSINDKPALGQAAIPPGTSRE
jgi:carbon storage regulator